jgi:hypothetical protein
MAKLDPQIFAHLEWISFVRPTGLVVSAPALVRAGAILDRRDAKGQRALRACLEEHVFDPKEGPVPQLPDFHAFAESVLGWSFSPKGFAGTAESPIPPELEVPLPDYGELLRPDFAVRELEPMDGASPWQLLVRVLEPGEDFDRVVRGNGTLEASSHGRMERLLRQTGVPAGLLFNGRALRLVSAPRGESSGWLDFHVADMVQTAGRPISTALRLLLGQARLLGLPRAQRLAALFEDSRKFQNEVSERLAEQVLHALYELLRGFQAAHDASKGELLRQPLAERPDEVYRALLTVILRLVFLLYAEERDMLPDDETFLRYYSFAGLYERLREDVALFPDTMDQRYGAWAQLLVLFRMVNDGAESGTMRLPKRQGVLFDPDRFPFLEGRPSGSTRQVDGCIEPPLVPDGTIYRALEKILVLDGERISYRALDVEQIGSVYETMMGFQLETATGLSVAIKAQKKHGAPTTVDLEALLAEPATKRAKWLQDRAGRKLTDKVKKAADEAMTVEDLHAALLQVIDSAATPDLVPKGAMVLQPSKERRRSGSHYTPRELTEPIVRTTLEPILKNLLGAEDQPPTPEQLLDLKVCDPAMGSGAFLVEACRQLGDTLVETWHFHGVVPEIPPDEDEVVFARRLIAQRCLYGVDRNPVAVDLAKVSLWLVTLARDHALTFVDHALRHGDSLVGLSRQQIEAFHWDTLKPPILKGFGIRESIDAANDLRRRIREADESVSDRELRDLWDEAQVELGKVRLFGNLVLAAFFEGEKPKERDGKRGEYATAVVSGEAERYRDWLEEWSRAEQPFAPFHWEIEFPEVFDRENAGFDAIIGNPPFLGATELGVITPAPHLDYVKQSIGQISGKTDLIAYFFRRTWALIRSSGTFGLIATNTIAQGDTHASGLLVIHREGGVVYSATKRLKWPGTAAVVVSVIHVFKGDHVGARFLDGARVQRISTYLFQLGPDEPPLRLAANASLAGKGVIHSGEGFVFKGEGGGGWPLSLAVELRKDPRQADVIKPFWGSKEINNSSNFVPVRYVIDLGDMSEPEAQRRYPQLYEMLTERVQPERMKLTTQSGAEQARKYWWQFTYRAEALMKELVRHSAMLAIGRVTHWLSVCKLPTTAVPSEQIVAIALDTHAAFCALQSRSHEIWARFFGSSLEDRLRYTPSDCFETFPFPQNWETHPALEAAGKAYYDFRATLMIKNDEGLTKTYNRFHDPDERDPEIAKLRELHAAMDRAVLDAYGWGDISTDCEFLLDYEIDEGEAGSRRKKPWRYRCPDEVREEVLARLLELNAVRAKEEVRSGTVADKKRRRKTKVSRVHKAPETGDLLL